MKTWESSQTKNGRKIVVEVDESFVEKGIRYYYKDSKTSYVIELEIAEAIVSAMTYFKNEGGAA